MKLILALLGLVLLFALSDACCKNHQVGSCCGNGGCNVFCCNCDGGCNSQCETDYGSYIGAVGTAAGVAALFGRKKRDLTSVDRRRRAAIERFEELDLNQDGEVTMKEAVSYLQKHSSGFLHSIFEKHPTWFEQIDQNGDGRIQPSELDWHL